MKKGFCLVLTVLIIAVLAGCTPKYLPQICGITGTESSMTAEVEFDRWISVPLILETQEKTKTVDFDGNTYECAYKESSYMRFTPSLKHTYNAETGEEFGIDSTGKLIYFVSPETLVKPEEPIAEDAAIAKAKETIKAHYPDIDLSAYKESIYFSEADGSYSLSYIKYLGEQITFDHFEMRISGTGKVVIFAAYLIGKVRTEMADTINLQNVKKRLYSKCDALTSKSKKSYDKVYYDDYSYILTVDEDGNPAMVVLTTIVFQNTFDQLASTHEVDIQFYFTGEGVK